MKGMELILTLTLLLLNFNPRRAFPLDHSISCCTQAYRKNLPIKLLRNIIQVELQEANGDCHIQAYVVHRKHGLPVCVHPKNLSLTKWLNQDKMRQKNPRRRPRLNPTP